MTDLAGLDDKLVSSSQWGCEHTSVNINSIWVGTCSYGISVCDVFPAISSKTCVPVSKNQKEITRKVLLHITLEMSVLS